MIRTPFLAAAILLIAFVAACSSAEDPTATPVPTSTPIPPTATSVPEPTTAPMAPTATAASVAPRATEIARSTAEARTEATTAAEEAATEAQPTTPEQSSQRTDSRQGGVFRLLGSDPVTLDPAQVSDSTAYDIVTELFGGLVRLTDDPNQPIIPDLAESYTVNSEGTVYRFVLREGLVFSDGSPLTAFDVKWSWERAAWPDTESPVVKEFLGDIVGINDIVDGNATSTDAIKVIDDQTLEVTIDAPKPYFIAKLTYPVTYVLNQDNVESGGNTWTDAPVGTGPFILKSYEIGVSLVLARNENYWGTPAFLDEVHFNLAGGSALAMYENDEIDVTGIPQSAFERVNDPEEEISKEVVEVPPEFVTYYIGFNVNQAPFDDVHFRRALNYAVDKDLIASEVLNGRVKPANGPVPPGFVGFNSALEPLGFDPEKAVEELNMSKYADPESRPRIIMTVSGTGGSPPTWLLAVTEMWSRHPRSRSQLRASRVGDVLAGDRQLPVAGILFGMESRLSGSSHILGCALQIRQHHQSNRLLER